MTLSTVDAQGWPDARVLILKNLDARGWHFAVKAGSPKVDQIEHTPQVALTFYWPQLGRQVRLRGPATALPPAECAADFLDRPAGARVNALASRQSEVLQDPADLERAQAEASAFVAAHPQHAAPGWRVYAVAPTAAEFWQGAADRNHQRLRYRLADDGTAWLRERLWP
ncbi:MAG: Pyridoxine/pyridoxamine 5'-phosphate oxidase [Burkholderia gladioli]|nr:MAG: Pyridoxine/pyridoxamine 5'-phosphate oxidase [Burkholderia gladioli]